MNRKQYLTFVIILAVLGVGLIAAYYIWNDFMVDNNISLLYPVLIVMLGYMFLRYKTTSPMQYLTTKFSMLVDYDLDIAGAVALCEKNYNNAPTSSLKAVYQVYYGMSLYYAGRYKDAVRILNTIDLRRLNVVYHALIWAFVCYSSFEDGDLETFNQTLDRIKNIQGSIPGRYQNFIGGYVEILDAIKNLDVNPEQYREIVEKHFAREDGYISTKLVYNYRMGLYQERMGNELEADKCFAFVIANGKEHHTALRSKEHFHGLVNVEDYVWTPGQTAPEEVVETQNPEAETPEIAEERQEPDETPAEPENPEETATSDESENE